MRLIVRKDIDDLKWNALVASSDTQNPLLYTWAMDATSEKWCAFVEGDYEFFWPVPFSENAGVKRARQQAFSRQMDVIGNIHYLAAAIEFAKREFMEFDIRISDTTLSKEKQRYQFLDLSKKIEYKTNAKRQIKKAKETYLISQSDKIEILVDLYQANSFLKFKQPKSNLNYLKKSMKSYLANEKGYLLIATFENSIKAAAFFIEDKETTYYLIGDAYVEDKKNGAIYGLIDYAIEKSILEGKKTVDFGGSNVDSVAEFYKKFGAEDKFYSRIFWDKLPFWFKFFQKIKQ